jgi:predicted molibdopterin-dependent oxidoreductase YjgC
MIKITINNKKVKAEEGMTILEAAQSAGIEIPTLCSNDALEPYGACRLCIVEIEQHKQKTIETSCTYQAVEGLIVKTDSPRVIESRKFVIELLLARCPNVKKVQDLAAEYKVTDSPIQWGKENDYCILCGLCVRACDEVVKAGAIQFAGKGADRIVDSPYHQTAEDCIGCGSCAFVCPTGIIKKQEHERTALCTPQGCEEEGPKREILNWHVEHEMKTCAKCGNPYAPAVLLEKIAEEQNHLMEFFNVCPSCRTTPYIDEELCTACNGCIVVCPIGAAQFVEDGKDQMARIFPENCCGCHSCTGVCGWGAIKVE